ncbi:MAG: hypothetical protein WBL19_00560 [Minisyncoccia bacterium]
MVDFLSVLPNEINRSNILFWWLDAGVTPPPESYRFGTGGRSAQYQSVAWYGPGIPTCPVVNFEIQ